MKSVALIPAFLLLFGTPSLGEGILLSDCSDAVKRDDSLSQDRDARRASLENYRRAIQKEQAKVAQELDAAGGEVAKLQEPYTRLSGDLEWWAQTERFHTEQRNRLNNEFRGRHDADYYNQLSKIDAMWEEARKKTEGLRARHRELTESLREAQDKYETALASKEWIDDDGQIAINCINNRIAELKAMDGLQIDTQVDIAVSRFGEGVQKRMLNADSENPPPSDALPPLGGARDRITTMPEGLPPLENVEEIELRQLEHSPVLMNRL